MTETDTFCPADIKISVAIITFNEEAQIRHTLESVLPFADQILVIDSHSQDHTAAISRQMGAEVIERTFAGYIEQKNFALDQCCYNHVFSIDGDEVVDQQTLPIHPGGQISMGRARDTPSIGRTHYVDRWIRHCGWYPDKKIRLDRPQICLLEGNVNPHDILQLDGDSKACSSQRRSAPLFLSIRFRPHPTDQPLHHHQRPAPIFKREYPFRLVENCHLTHCSSF